MARFIGKKSKLLAVGLVLMLSMVQFIPLNQALANPISDAYTVSPSSWQVDSLPKKVTITSSVADTFHTGVQVYLKQGSTTSQTPATTFMSGTEINFTVDSGLADGVYDLYINDSGADGGQYVTGKTFTVGSPSVTISPASMAKNYSQQVTITVTGTKTNFSSGQTTVEIFKDGVKQDYVSGTPSVTNSGSLTFALKTGLATGVYDLKFTTTFDDKNEIFTQTGALTVRDTASISISPTILAEGYSSTTITVTGTNTGFNDQTVVKVIDAQLEDTAKAGTPTIASATSLTFSVNTGLAAGDYTVEVQTGDEVAQTSLTVGEASMVLKYGGSSFTGMPEGYSAYNLVLEGTNTSFNQGTTTLAIYLGEAEQTGKITNLQVSSTTSATFTLGTGLSGGTYTVKATTGDQVVTASITVAVPTLSSVTIGSEVAAGSALAEGYQDSTVTVAGSNTLFTASSTVGIYQSDVEQANKATSLNVANSTNLTFTLVSGLTDGTYDILIDVDGNSSTTTDQLSSSFTVTNPSFFIVPNSVVNNDSSAKKIVVTGTNTHFTKATPVITIKKDNTETSVGTISNINATTDTNLEFNLTPNSLTTAGTYTIVISTNKTNVIDETVTQAGILTVSSAGISSVTPSLIYTDELSTTTISVTGSGTNFSGTTTVSIAGVDTAITPTINSAESLSFSPPTDLAVGTYTLDINDGTAYQATFQVQSRSISLSTKSKTYGYSTFNMTVSGVGIAFDTTKNRPTVKIYNSSDTQVDTGITLQDANISSTQFIFTFPTSLAGGTYTVKVSWADVTTDYPSLVLTDTIVINQSAPTLADVTVTDPTGYAKNGKVLVTDNRADTTNGLMYRVTDATITTPNVGAATTDYTLLPVDGLVALNTGQYLSIVSVTGSPATVVTYKVFQVNPVNEAAVLTDVTVADATGWQNNDKVLVTDDRTDKTNSLMYKVTSSTVSTPVLGSATTGYTALPVDGLVSIAAGQYLSIVSVSGSPATIVAFKEYQVDPVNEVVLGATVTGTVTLQGLTDDSGVTVTVQGVDPAITATTDAAGAFSLTGVADGTYTLVFTKTKYLVKKATVTVASGAQTGDAIAVTMLVGDLNGDNSIDALDLTTFAQAYGKAEGETGYNAVANLNTDAAVDALDLTLFAQNYSKTGE